MFMSPVDDWLVLKYIKVNPQASKGAIRAIKSAVNHGIDFGQGVSEVVRRGEYQLANGQKVTNWFAAGVASVFDGAYQSQKASNPQNAQLDLLPKLVVEQIRRDSANGQVGMSDSLLDVEVEQKIQGQVVKRRVRDLITGMADLEDFAAQKDEGALFTIFNQRLIDKGVPVEQILGLHRRAIAKVSGAQVRLGEVETYLDDIVREKKLADLADGKIQAEEIFSERNAFGRPFYLHHRMSAGDAVIGGALRNAEVRKVVDRVAKDFGLSPVAFENYVIDRVQADPKLAPSFTLRTLAKEKLAADRQRRLARR